MAQSLSLQQSQHLTLTPQLKQALAILQLSTAELTQTINAALEDNPLLEVEPPEESQSPDDEGEVHWENLPSSEEPWEGREKAPSLAEHLRLQAGCLPLSAKDKELLDWLIGSLDEDGFLNADLNEIAAEADVTADATIRDWRMALLLLQSMEPAGVGARDSKDALHIQIRLARQSERFPGPICDLADIAVTDYLELIANHRTDKLRNALGCSAEDLKSALSLIAGLTPRPASEFSADTINYVIPEVKVVRSGPGPQGGWRAVLTDSAIPKIRINELYANAVSAEKDRDVWQSRLKDAKELLRSIDQRRTTLLRVADAIVRYQSEFFDQGPHAMKPLVLRRIAEELELHESTVSRVSAGKYLICPQGVFELKYFFSSQLPLGDTGESVSSTAVKSALKALIENESSAKPLSDAKLAELLNEKGFPIARRTIAKYRESLGFPAASQRKKI